MIYLIKILYLSVSLSPPPPLSSPLSSVPSLSPSQVILLFQQLQKIGQVRSFIKIEIVLGNDKR